MKCSCKFRDPPSRTFDETRACELPTKERTQKIIAPRNCMCQIMSKHGRDSWRIERCTEKNCSIIQRICATHSIKLTDPLKSRIKSVAIKSSEHQHERDIQMMGSDKSSGLYQLRKAGKEFPLKCRVREKINLPNICYVFANSTFVAKKALY